MGLISKFKGLLKSFQNIFSKNKKKIDDTFDFIDNLAVFLKPQIIQLTSITKTHRDDDFVKLALEMGFKNASQNYIITLFRNFRDNDNGVKLDFARKIIIELLKDLVNENGFLNIGSVLIHSIEDLTNKLSNTVLLTAIQNIYAFYKIVKE